MKKVIMFLALFIIPFAMCSCKKAKDPEEIISVNYNTQIEEALFGMPFDYELSEKDKERGFISVEKKDDNVAVYKIKRKDYEAFISELGTYKKEIFDKFNNQSDSAIKSVSYNESLTEIVISVDREDYENVSYENDSNYWEIVNCSIGCGNNVSQYHCFSTGEFRECEIKIVDNNTGDVLRTDKYPEALLK